MAVEKLTVEYSKYKATAPSLPLLLSIVKNAKGKVYGTMKLAFGSWEADICLNNIGFYYESETSTSANIDGSFVHTNTGAVYNYSIKKGDITFDDNFATAMRILTIINPDGTVEYQNSSGATEATDKLPTYAPSSSYVVYYNDTEITA